MINKQQSAPSSQIQINSHPISHFRLSSAFPFPFSGASRKLALGEVECCLLHLGEFKLVCGSASTMKGRLYGLSGRRVYLLLIALVCATVVVWAPEKTPLLSSWIPPKITILQLPQDDKTKQAQTLQEEAGSGQKEGSITLKAPTNSTVATVTVEEPESGSGLTKSQPEISRKAESNSVRALNSTSVNSSIREDGNKNSKTRKEIQACNFAKGKWEADDNRPLYSGSACKQWLSPMWACRLTQRMDFEYEKLRWYPKDCPMEDFTGTRFLERMKNKTLAFIGDSLGRQQFQSLMCMITSGEERSDVLDVGGEYGLVKAPGAKRPDGWAYRFPSTNTTILYYWSASLCDLEPLNISNPETDYAMHLDRPPAFLKRFLHGFDVLVLNTGHHWNRGKLNANRWVMYVGGMPNINQRIADIGGAKNFTIYSIANWVNLQLPSYPGLKAFFRTLSPRHFFNGDWNTGGTCDNITPLSSGKEVSQNESSDPIVSGAVKGTNVKLLDITALSQLRDEGHISRYSLSKKAVPGIQDCLHWCLPGIPDTWNEILFAQL